MRHTSKNLIVFVSAALGFILCMGVGTALAASEIEPNDGFADATPMTMGETMYGCMDSDYVESEWWNNDDDYYKLEVPEAGSVQITITRTALAGSWMELYVYDSYCEKIGKIIGSSSLKPCSNTFNFKSGSYYLKADMWCGAARGSYLIRASYVITPTAITKLSPGSKSFTAKWGKVTATGYQVKYSTSKSLSGAKTVTVAKNGSSTAIKGLKAKKKYYVKVRAHRVIDGKTYYSAWSAKKSVTTK